MTPRWQAISRIYHAALERPPSERAAFLAKACAGDTELHHDLIGVGGAARSPYPYHPVVAHRPLQIIPAEAAPPVLDGNRKTLDSRVRRLIPRVPSSKFLAPRLV
jgi:hypothetical protein